MSITISTINDPRIGIRGENGRILQRPSRYATGDYWNMSIHSSPTTVYFGENNKFYYILPIGHRLLAPDIESELHSIVDEAIRQSESTGGALYKSELVVNDDDINDTEDTSLPPVSNQMKDTGTGGFSFTYKDN